MKGEIERFSLTKYTREKGALFYRKRKRGKSITPLKGTRCTLRKGHAVGCREGKKQKVSPKERRAQQLRGAGTASAGKGGERSRQIKRKGLSLAQPGIQKREEKEKSFYSPYSWWWEEGTSPCLGEKARFIWNDGKKEGWCDLRGWQEASCFPFLGKICNESFWGQVKEVRFLIGEKKDGKIPA